MIRFTRPLLLTKLVALLALSACQSSKPLQDPLRHSVLSEQPQESFLTIQYLELVTPEVDATCKALEEVRGVTFGDALPELGFARTASLANGGRIGVRAPLRATELPVVRPYLLVPDVEAALQAAQAAGGEIALPATELPGQGKFAIYLLGGIDHGLWEH